MIQAEMMVHPALFLHKKPKLVLAIGMLTPDTVQEILRHTSVETLIWINGADEPLPVSPKIKRIIQEEEIFLKEASGRTPNQLFGKGFLETDRFDVVISDMPLSSLALTVLKSMMSEDGIITLNAGSPIDSTESQAVLAHNLKNQFKKVNFYHFPDPTCNQGIGSAALASNHYHPIDDLKIDRIAASDLKFYYYNYGIHEGAFLLPEFQKENLKQYLSPL